MKKIIPLIITILLPIILLCGCKKEEKEIKEPDIVQIRSICNLATLECKYHNVARSKKEAGTGISHWGETAREFWVEYTGVAKVGINMEKVQIEINENKVKVSIPNAEVLSIGFDQKSLTEDSCYISEDSFFNKNKITDEDQLSAINNAQGKMEETVNANSGLLKSAEERAKDLIENYINKMGELSGIEYQIEWITVKE